jgi:tRNA (cytidine56-2'-O)-methyltransferase
MIVVLRIGHRISRDKRITTHVALVARAFNADRILIDTEDKKIEETIRSTCDRFGGNFEIKTGVDIKKVIRNWNGNIIHLTMYGEEFQKTIKSIDKKRDLLIIVGAEKVPAYIYEKADYNVSIGNQPHSEVAALAIFLDKFTEGRWQKKRFNGKIKIIASNKGKKVVSKGE